MKSEAGPLDLRRYLGSATWNTTHVSSTFLSTVQYFPIHYCCESVGKCAHRTPSGVRECHTCIGLIKCFLQECPPRCPTGCPPGILNFSLTSSLLTSVFITLRSYLLPLPFIYSMFLSVNFLKNVKCHSTLTYQFAKYVNGFNHYL
jgi:hypothetical protein